MEIIKTIADVTEHALMDTTALPCINKEKIVDDIEFYFEFDLPEKVQAFAKSELIELYNDYIENNNLKELSIKEIESRLDDYRLNESGYDFLYTEQMVEKITEDILIDTAIKDVKAFLEDVKDDDEESFERIIEDLHDIDDVYVIHGVVRIHKYNDDLRFYLDDWGCYDEFTEIEYGRVKIEFKLN